MHALIYLCLRLCTTERDEEGERPIDHRSKIVLVGKVKKKEPILKLR